MPEQDGPRTDYDKEGRVTARYTLLNGGPDGRYVYYYENGQVRHDVPYVRGVHHGISRHYSPDGAPLATFVYENGQLLLPYFMWKDGCMVYYWG